MDTNAATWLATDLDLLTVDIAQLRIHLEWLREDLALLPTSAPDRAASVAALGRDIDASVRKLADLTRALGVAE